MRFHLVDRILELESGRRAIGLKNVTMSEDFLADHFPEQPIMPGVMIAESMIQLADWVIRESSEFRTMGLVSSIDRLRFRQFVLPGDQLRLEVEITALEGTTATVKGKAYRDNELVTSAEFTLSLHPALEHVSMEQMGRLYKALRPEREGVKIGGD